MMQGSAVIQQMLLPLHSIRIGRLVVNVDEPQQEFLDPDCDLNEITTSTMTQYSVVQRDTSGESLRATMMSLLSAFFSKHNKTTIEVSTDRVTTYQLTNSGRWFQNAVQSQRTRQWIEESVVQGNSIYVVVGYRTTYDARIIEREASERESSMKLRVPSATELASMTSPAPTTGDEDQSTTARLTSNAQDGESVKRKFVATGEQIWAVQYRKVQFKWFSSRNLDSPLLGPGQWHWYTDFGDRGEESTNDVVEVNLLDEFDVEGDYEKHLFPIEGVFFC